MRAREEKIRRNTRFLKKKRMLRKGITAALLGTMLASAVMGQTVYAEENVPSDDYVVAHGETFDNNDKTGVTNNGTINNNSGTGLNNGTINNNSGNVTNNGTINNNSGTGANNGTINNNSGNIYNSTSGTVTNNNNGGVTQTNHGTVTNNNSGGRVEDNYGTVTNNNNSGLVSINYGTVTNNSGIVSMNRSNANIDTNQSTGIVEINKGLVKTNYGTVDNQVHYDSLSSTIGAVDMNYGTVNTISYMCGYVGTNFGTVNGANNALVTIINNYGEGVTANESTVNISNQFYSVDFTNTNSSVTYTSGFQTSAQDLNNKQWIQTKLNDNDVSSPQGTITLIPDSGYEISGDDATDAAGASETKTFTYSVQKQADGSAVITISSPSGNINVDASTFGLVIQLIQQSTGGGGGGPVTVIVNNDDNDDDHHSYNNSPSSEPESYNAIPDGAIIISLPGTTASTAVAAAGPAVLGAGRTPARVVKLKVSELTNAQFKEAVISNINATPAGGLLLIETDRIGTFDRAMLEAFAMKGNVDMEVLFPLGKNKISVTIPAGTDINKLLDDKGYCGFLRLLAILGGKTVTK